MTEQGNESQQEVDMPSSIRIRIDDEKRAAIDAIARSLNRDRSFVVNEAIDLYLDLHRWQAEHIRRGVAEADAGDFASEAEVAAFFGKYPDQG